jgi:hypothetical protein
LGKSNNYFSYKIILSGKYPVDDVAILRFCPGLLAMRGSRFTFGAEEALFGTPTESEAPEAGIIA